MQVHTRPFAAPTPPAARHRGPQKKMIWVVVIILLIAGLGTGGYFAWAKGYISLPFIKNTGGGDLFEKMIGSLSTINNAQYGLRLNFVGQPRKTGAESLFPTNSATNGTSNLNTNTTLGLGTPDTNPLDDFFDTEMITKNIPADIQLNGGLTFYAETDKPAADANAFIKIDGTYTGGDATVAVEVEARKVEKNIYALVSKFPSIFFLDLSGIKGTWVAITPDDQDSPVSEDMLQQADLKKGVVNLQDTLRRALENKVFTVDQKLPSETVAGTKAEHYRVSIHPEALTAAYDSAIKDKRTKNEDTKSLETMVANLQKQETIDALNRFAKNSALEVWIGNDGILRQIKWGLTIVPPDTAEKLKDKQFLLELTLTLENINKKVDVKKPGDTIPYDEAVRLVSGITKEEQDFDKQTTRVEKVRDGLQEYFRVHHAYPDSLEQLTTALQQQSLACEKQQKQTETALANDARARSRDAQRQSNLSQIWSALALYYDDQADPAYPATISGISPTYLTNVPTDPDTKKDYRYERCNDGKSFLLTADLETTTEKYYIAENARGRSATTQTCGKVDSTQLQDATSTSECLTLASFKKGVTITDVYTGKPYGYTKDGDDFRLTYEVRLPKDASSYLTDAYQEGQNTATSKDVSVEKTTTSEQQAANRNASLATNRNTNTTLSQNTNTTTANTNTTATPAKIDSDHDGLSDDEEKTYQTRPTNIDTDSDGLTDYQEVHIYRTNPLQRDTDGDGYDDKTEITSGYDPNGPGTLLVPVGAWTSCVSLDSAGSCAAYCTSIGKVCKNTGVTSRGYPNRGAEAWTSPGGCTSTIIAGSGQLNCTDPTDGGGARWKCFCL